MTYRCFIALEPPEAVAKCLQTRLRELNSNPQVKWVSPQNLHVTMLFLGDTDASLIPDIAAVVERHADEFPTPKLSLRGLELFPSREPRLVWASLKSEDDAIFGLHKALLKDIRALGCSPDPKPLKLHITLGRTKTTLPVWLEESVLKSSVDSMLYDYSRLTIYRSVLRPEGPTYHILHQFELNTRR